MKKESSRRLIVVQIIIAVVVLLALAASYTQLRANRWLLLSVQGLPTFVLLAWVAMRPVNESPRYRWGIVTAFFFSQIGGGLLGVPGYFVEGVFGYLLANLAYVTAFTSGVRFARHPLPFVILGLVPATVLTLTWSNIPDVQRLPVIFYAATLVSASAQAITRSLDVRKIGAVTAAIGMPLLLISDSAIAINRFYESFWGADLLIMATYFIGQWLIALSVGQSSVNSEQGD